MLTVAPHDVVPPCVIQTLPMPVLPEQPNRACAPSKSGVEFEKKLIVPQHAIAPAFWGGMTAKLPMSSEQTIPAIAKSLFIFGFLRRCAAMALFKCPLTRVNSYYGRAMY